MVPFTSEVAREIPVGYRLEIKHIQNTQHTWYFQRMTNDLWAFVDQFGKDYGSFQHVDTITKSYSARYVVLNPYITVEDDLWD